MSMDIRIIALVACKLLIRKQQRKIALQGAQGCPKLHREGRHAVRLISSREDNTMKAKAISLWREDSGQDIAEYAVMLAVILVIVVGTIRLIGSNANNVFSSVASSVQ